MSTDRSHPRVAPAALLALAVAACAGPARAGTLEQVISREHHAFHPASARLTVGRDGRVYFCNPSTERSYVLRIGRDGKQKYGRLVGPAARNATANADGTIATANGHFGHRVALYDTQLNPAGSVDDFLGSDAVGWDAPAHVEAGAGGDFYGLDQHRNRILRLSPAGKPVRSYPIPREPNSNDGIAQEFRVSEKAEAFYLLTRAGTVHCVGFDGKTRWSARVGVTWGEPNVGGFDVDADGTLFAIENKSDSVKRLSAAGKPLADVKLRLGACRPSPTEHGFTDLRVHNGEAIIKRRHDTELFQRYDLATGKQLQVVHSEHERLTVTLPDGPWAAGQLLPFSVRLTGGARPPAPRWRVWARSPDDVDYRELTVTAGRLQVPKDGAGVYLIKVTPDVQPWQAGPASEYGVRTWVEIRRPRAAGSANVFTPNNRVAWARGEAIPCTVLVRSPLARGPIRAHLRLTQGGRTLAERVVDVKPGAPLALTLPASLTDALRPGRYALTASVPGLTTVPQTLRIGPGSARSGFHTLQYGDYTPPLYPTAGATPWVAADLAAAHVRRTVKLGLNLMVDRLGEPGQLGALDAGGPGQPELAELAKRLEADPLATAPQKAVTVSPLRQVMAGFGGAGVDQMAILMMNDAGLPLGGKGFDPRKPPELTEAITRVTRALRPYSSFRGWSWSSNWWIYQRGADAARTPTERAEYEAALRKAKETGAWDPVLERVSGYRLSYAVEAQALFNKALKAADPGSASGRPLVTASAAPHRNVEAYPPVTLANVDEVDLHAQWEQLAPPYVMAHGVDFYKRPGKRAWAHAEVWNDAGTGEQILPTLFQAVMRGADGVGFNGPLPPWGVQPEDPRSSYAGTASVYRALNGVLRQYGPWLATLHNNDRVAIVVSGRMFRIDEWGPGVTGIHFARLWEAYSACLHAHHPATFVFVEDLKPDTLKQYRAVLLVGQTVEMEPALTDALKTARAAGVRVFCDGTCRPSLVKGLTPLGVAFNKFETDTHPASDDSAYWRFAAYCRAHVPALSKALATATPPVATVDHPEVLVSERKALQGRYLFVVNNTTPKLEPGHLWRVSLAATSRVPVVARVRLATKGATPRAVYDVFAGKQVEPKDGAVLADCRSLPARVYAVLPEPIAEVKVWGPQAVQPGQRFAWSAVVQDAAGRPIPASIPVRIRLLDADGAVLDERFAATDDKDARGTLTAFLNGPAGAWVLEATELFSGKSARLTLKVPALLKPVGLAATQKGEAAADVAMGGKEATPTFAAADAAFGPHIRDIVLTDNGGLAVLSAMNWDHNLYAVDVATGSVRWRQKVGHYFAFAPRPLADGFAVQGFDFPSAEGYHLYLAGAAGKPQRRFALYGLPRRLPHRFVPGMLSDRINNFAVPDDGAWVASAGDLGLAVWKRDGKLLWSQDWWKTRRHTAALAALGPRTLLVVEGLQATAHDAETGKPLWELALGTAGSPGTVRDVRVSRDGKTCALLSDAEGGRVHVVHAGKLVRTIPSGANAIELSPDGSHVALALGNQLQLYSVADGLRWVLPADDTVRYPRFAADGKRLAIASELGTVYVVGLDGRVLLERDLGALAVPAWLPDGDLLLGTWMGTVCRLDSKYKERWRTLLRPEATDAGRQLLAKERAPTSRVTTWGNADTTRPGRLGPNLLSPSVIRFQGSQPHYQLARDAGPLVDGKPTPPPGPWLRWSDVGWFAELSPVNYLVLDTYRTQVRATAITFFEDPKHPESWLRDATLEYWDPAKEAWVHLQSLLSDAAVHTHRFARPVETSRFRIGLPGSMVGNLRLGEIHLYGKRLGPSHLDAAAGRAVAVLFDEKDDLKEGLVVPNSGLTFQHGGAYSGDRYLSVEADRTVYPIFQPPFGHALPNWDFEITPKPAPGQYRWLQFAWRAPKPARGVAVQLGVYGQQPLVLYAGDYKPPEGVVAHKVQNAAPEDWTVVRVDLLKLFGRPTRVQMLALGSAGGPAQFDQILLGRTEKDLLEVLKKKK